MRSVVQEWVAANCSWKEQTVLFCALRGPDAGGSADIKYIIRWIRRKVLENAAPKKTFMEMKGLYEIKEIADKRPLVLDMLPVHFLGHLIHAFQVIAYRHPDDETHLFALHAYLQLCEYLHLKPESDHAMRKRLTDEIDHA